MLGNSQNHWRRLVNPSDNLNIWKLVLALGRTGNLTKAAIHVDMELSAASRVIVSLEDELGATLIDRRTKPYKLTPVAKSLLPRVEQMLTLHKSILSDATHDEGAPLRTMIRISVPNNIARKPILEHLVYYRTHVDPTVEFEMISDLTHADVLSGRADIAFLPYFPGDVPELFCDPFLPGTTFMLASPAYLEKYGTPREPEDLIAHQLYFRSGTYYPYTRCLFSDREVFDLETMTRTTIPENISGNELRTLKTNAISNGRLSNPYLNVFYGDSLACLQGILDGSGISVDLALGFTSEYLQSGALVPVLPNWHRPLWINTLVVHEKNRENETLMRFLHWFSKVEAKHGRKRWFEWFQRFGQDPEGLLKRGY